MDLNKVQIIWRTTEDIVVKETPNGKKVTSFSVATNKTWTDGNGEKKEVATFHHIVLWGKIAEIAGNYLSKWKRVYIEWSLQTSTWEAEDKSKRYKTEIVWDNLILLDPKDGVTIDEAKEVF